MDYTYEQRVANSIKLLDDNVGKFDWLTADWRSKINLDKLDMYSVTNCVLGQLEGYYDSAHECFEGIGVDIGGGSYIFHIATSEWIEALKASTPKFQSGQVWHGKDGDTRTVLSVNDVKGILWITFEASYVSGITAVHVRNEAAFVDGYSLEKPKRFTKGDELLSKDGDVFYYISDDKVIQSTNKGLRWSSLYWYEKEFGPLTKRACPTTEFFFDGKMFWND